MSRCSKNLRHDLTHERPTPSAARGPGANAPPFVAALIALVALLRLGGVAHAGDDLIPDDVGKTQDKAVQPAPASKNGTPVLLIPFQPIFRSAPAAKVQVANELLAKELGHHEGLVVIRAGIAKGEAAAPNLDGAQKALDEARSAEAARDISRAISLRRRALEEMEKNLAAVSPEDYVEAHLSLARALMWSGDDPGATALIEQASGMNPALKLEPSEYSRLFRRWFQKAAERAIQSKAGELLVSSALPGAEVMLDGRPMEVTPVLLKQVVPGKHLLAARLEGVPPYSSVVEVKSGQKSEVSVAFANTLGGSAVGVVADALAQNALPRRAVEAAARAGKEAGARFALLGALAKDEDRFRVHAFLVDVGSGKIASLKGVDFDLEMLTAESDVLKIVDEAAKLTADFGSKEDQVAVIEQRIKPQNTVNEVAAAPSLSGDGSKKREPVGVKKSRAVYQPLKGGTLKIKDETD